ncbi:MAG: hypothetical protein R3E79_01705 [Caldilineaceae bacterium]
MTENPDAALLMEKLLSKEIRYAITYVPRTDYSWAQSTAAVLVRTKPSPVILVLNADSVDPETIRDRRVMNEELIGFPKTKRIKVALAIPEVEILLFQDRAILEELFDCEISDVDWARAEFIPRTILQKLLTQGPQSMTLEELLDQLTPPMIEKLRHHPLLQDLTEFLVETAELQPVLA